MTMRLTITLAAPAPTPAAYKSAEGEFTAAEMAEWHRKAVSLGRDALPKVKALPDRLALLDNMELHQTAAKAWAGGAPDAASVSAAVFADRGISLDEAIKLSSRSDWQGRPGATS